MNFCQASHPEKKNEHTNSHSPLSQDVRILKIGASFRADWDALFRRPVEVCMPFLLRSISVVL